jgi:hypothetical protein
LTDFSEVRTASIITALMMEAARTSETLAIFYQTTWRNIPEGCHLHTRRRENLKSPSHIAINVHISFQSTLST